MKRQVRWSLATIATFAVILAVYAPPVAGQDFSLWGSITPGPHAVGFETFEVRDLSRSFGSGKDYYGANIPGETVRMVQILIWYPAVATDDDIAMTWGEYAYPYPEDDAFGNLAGQMQNRDLNSLGMFLRGGRGLISDVIALELKATRSALHAEGSFPLVIYHAGAQLGTVQNIVLCEYLASRGYVVATTHSVGAFALDPGQTAVDLEAMTRDRELVMSELSDYAAANLKQIALVGFGRGGSSAILQAMRNPGVDGVVLLEGAILHPGMYDDLTANPFFDPRAIKAPLLCAVGDSPMEITRNLLDSLRYTERHVASFTSMGITAMTNYAIISTMRTDSAAPAEEPIRSGYELTCKMTADFIDQVFGGTETSRTAALDAHAQTDRLSFEHIAGSTLPPTSDQLRAIIRPYGVNSVVALVDRFSLANPDSPVWDANTVIGIGYRILQRGQAADACKIMKIGVDCYPTMANAWDSYGEMRAADGDTEGALSCYQKALELIPTDPTLTPGFRARLEVSIPATIERLKEQLAGESGSSQ